jgi:hypothetical protein
MINIHVGEPSLVKLEYSKEDEDFALFIQDKLVCEFSLCDRLCFCYSINKLGTGFTEHSYIDIEDETLSVIHKEQKDNIPKTVLNILSAFIELGCKTEYK